MKFTGSAFKQLRFTGVLLLLAIVTIAGLMYWQSVEQRRQYLTSRDFRMLSVLATQVQNLFDGQARIFQGAAEDVDLKTDAHRPIAVWRKAAIDDVPFLRDADVAVDQPLRSGSQLAPPKLVLDADGNRFRLRVDLVTTGDGQPNEKPQAVLTVRTPLATLLGQTFLKKLEQGVFDTLALATPDGRVVFATGRRQQELQSTPLDALIPSSLADPKQFPNMARTISVQDAVVASVPYKMFLQPCCGTVAFPSASGPARGGLLIAGLVEADALHSAALAISPTLVITGILATILAFVIWPFLRLSFIGERQRVTVWDVVQLAACSILGLAVAAIVIITADVYTRLNADIDEQLEGLAKTLNTHLHQEIRLAYGRLSELERYFYEKNKGDEPSPEVVSCLHSDRSSTCPGATAGSAIGVREYEAFALIDANGKQQVKSTPTNFVPSRIRVQGRNYVDAIARGRYWRNLSECTGGGSPGCFLESVWSWTDGQPQAVLSKPIGRSGIEAATATAGSDAASDERPASADRYRVAALAFSLQTLNEPVLPPGFEFAVIDSRGNVLFHSDRQRNILEDLFIETDQDRRLRALVAGHSAGALSIQYWGRPFRAHVEPAEIADWSIITLSEQGPIRGLVLEWTAVSLLMLSLYLLVWVLCVVMALRFGTSWIWPDPRRRRSYAVLAVAYAILFLLLVAVASTGDTPRLLRTAVAIAVAAWALAYVLLRKRPEAHASTDPRSQASVTREYAMAGALFLTLCGIVPGIAFVVRSYDMHVESYIKHRQLGLARSLQERTEPSDRNLTCDSTAELDRNCHFFYQTTVASIDRHSDPVLSEKMSKSSRDEATHHELLLELLEEYLPYYAESSVFMRELMHDHAADDSWRSTRTPGGCLELRWKQGLDSAVLVKSALPDAAPRWPWQNTQSHDATVCDEPLRNAQGQTLVQGLGPGDEEGHAEQMLIMPYLAPWLLGGLIGVAFVMVRFVLRHVYLVGVSEPLWAAGGLVETAGANVLIRYDESSRVAARLGDMSVLTLGPIARSDDSSAAWRQALMKLSRDDAGHALVITDLDADLDNVDLTRTKLELLEELVNDPTRTVVVLLKTPPATFQDSIRRGRDATLMEMWSRLFKSFVMMDWRGGAKRTEESKPAPEPQPQTKTSEPADPVVGQSRLWNWREWRRRHQPLDAQTVLGQILDTEGRYDRFIRSICEDIRRSDAFQSGTVTAEQILDEIDDRSATYYQRIWASCSDDEKVVLGHVALHGLTTAASRRVVRRLLARRLLTKDPDLRLMNRTFKNFMLSPDIQHQVVALEGSAEASTWDRLRVPFALSMVTAGVFLFTTQREMFNQTVAAVTALAGLVPTVLRTVSVIAQRDAASGPPQA